MAFDLNGWSKISASANMKAPALFGYRSTDSTNTLLSDGYFNAMRNSLKVGDLLMIVSIANDNAEMSYTCVHALTPNVKTLQ